MSRSAGVPLNVFVSAALISWLKAVIVFGGGGGSSSESSTSSESS